MKTSSLLHYDPLSGQPVYEDATSSREHLLFRHLALCASLPFSPSSNSLTAAASEFRFDEMIGMLQQSQAELDSVAELIDYILASRILPVVSSVPAEDVPTKNSVLMKTATGALRSFRDKSMDEIEKQRELLEQVVMPLVSDGWRILHYHHQPRDGHGKVLVDLSPARLYSASSATAVVDPYIVTVNVTTSTIENGMPNKVLALFHGEQKLARLGPPEAAPSSNRTSSLHSLLWSARDARLQREMLRVLQAEASRSFLEDRPLCTLDSITLVIGSSAPLRICLVDQDGDADASSEDGNAYASQLLRDMRRRWVESAGRSVGWSEARQALHLLISG